jgi:hypothetical protein
VAVEKRGGHGGGGESGQRARVPAEEGRLLLLFFVGLLRHALGELHALRRVVELLDGGRVDLPLAEKGVELPLLCV